MTIPEVFEQHARATLANYPELSVRWCEVSGGAGRELFIPKQDASGFDITVRAETYGLYPFADDGWHGAPWEVGAHGVRTIDEQIVALCDDFVGFVRALLCADAALQVFYAGTSPFRWVLSWETESGRESEECGLLFYNYFAKKRIETRQNRHIPERFRRY